MATLWLHKELIRLYNLKKGLSMEDRSLAALA
jgi:hypothetical protein